jgi:hypothetical protein
VNNFGKEHPCKLLLDFKRSSSKVATFKQIQDYAHFEFLQTNLILHTTTTIVSQILYESTPPKIIAKCQNSSLAAIVSNTWQAQFYQLHTPFYPAYLSLNNHA